MRFTKIKSFNEIMISFTKTKDDLILYRDNESKKQQDAHDKMEIQHDKARACDYAMDRADKAIHAMKELLGE